MGAYLPLFVVFLALFGGEFAELLHVEFMLFMLAAGFFVENVSPVVGEPLVAAIERVSTPVYALFFALAGASIHLRELAALWPIALAVVAIRAAAIWAGCRIGAGFAGAEEVVRRYDPELLSFFNANTPEAYTWALERARSELPGPLAS